MTSPSALSLTLRTLYAELRELSLAVGACENIGELPGTVVTKRVRARVYLYHQYRDVSGSTRQTYLGPDDTATRALVSRLATNDRARGQDLERLRELSSAFIAAGGTATANPPFRVIKAFADAGLLRPGHGQAVLVGTHAFLALGNLLGVRWASQLSTHDIDLAADRDIDIALERPELNVGDVLENLGMGFIPVPSLNPRSPSTSFRVRGKELRVDLLTPRRGRGGDAPIFVPALNAPAQPLRFLDYLLESPVAVPVLSSSDLALVNVPRPARFALHKLLVSESRGEAFATKAQKDREQAAQVIEVLLEEAPDAIAEAKAELVRRGRGWTGRVERALRKLGSAAPDLGRLR